MKIKDVDYVLNPSLGLHLGLTLRSRKGEVLESKIDLRADRQITQILIALAEVKNLKGRLPKTVRDNLDFLVEAKMLVPKGQTPKKIVSEWRISKGILDFVPARMRSEAQTQMQSERLEFNAEHVFFQDTMRRPETKFQGMPPSTTFPSVGADYLWIFDPGTKMWSTYVPHPALATCVKKLVRNKSAIKRLSPVELEILMHARVVVVSGYAKTRAKEASQSVRAMHRHLRSKKFVLVREMIHPLQIACMRKYYRELEDHGYLKIDPDQVINKRYFRNNDPLLRFVHRQSGELMRAISGQSILPSYSFVSAYMEGAKLKRHTDRPQCRWNASLLIDENPETTREDSWPIFLQTPKRVEEVRLDFGDALFYSGTDLPHWRHTIAKGRRQTLGLLHFVPVNFVGDLD